MITLHRLDLSDAKQILSQFAKDFGLGFSNELTAWGNAVTVSAIKDEELSEKFTTPRFILTISSSYFTDYTLRKSLGGFDDEFFFKY